jgi:hypothetical protein
MIRNGNDFPSMKISREQMLDENVLRNVITGVWT